MTVDRRDAPVVVDGALLPSASRGARREQLATRVLIRPLMRHLRLDRRGIAFLRVATDLPTRFDRPVRGSRIEPVRTEHVRGEWVSAPG
ncbi:MAG TPA: hypothetical protein VHH12_06350, partial [Mycobacterium sp.]|nr:hypothetical protein [Mycobacterium sp.]